MEVTFGVQARDGSLRVEVPDDEIAALKKQLEDALSGDTTQILWMTDKNGREYGIPSDKIAFVEIGKDKAGRQVGFSAAS